MPFPICLNSNTYHGFSIDDAISGAAMAGIALIELSAVAGYTEHVMPDNNDAQVDSLLDRLALHGIRAVALGGHANLTSVSGRRAFRRNLELGARLGVDYVTTGTGETHGDELIIDDEDAFIGELRILAAHASSLGLRIALETHGRNYATGAAVSGLVERVGSDAVGVNYDTGNTIFYAGTPPYRDLQVSLPNVIGVHLKDKTGEQHDWNFPAIGEGDTDFARVLDILSAGPRDVIVPLSVEVEFTPAGPADLEAVHRAVRTSVDTLRQLGHTEGLAR